MMNKKASRRIVLQAALAAVTLLGCHPLSAIGQSQSAALELRRGVSTFPWFSLTREYPAPRTDYGWPPFQETRAVPTSDDLRRLAAAGLDFIRIPVDPGPFLAAQPTQRQELLDMLMDAVNSAIAAGLTVIVNIHVNGGTHFWNPDRLLSGLQAPAFSQYQAFVGEVAGRLATVRSDKIAFEPVNEPQQACASDVWFSIQRELLSTARNAAPDLTLVATGGCGSMVTGLAALDPAPLQVFEPILYTFHFYEPYLFSHQGAPWMVEPVYRSLNAVPWPASAGTLDQTLAAVRTRMEQDQQTSPEQKQAAYQETVKVLKVYFDAQPDKRFIDGYLDIISTWGRQHGVAASRILMGEFGALRTDARYVAAPLADRARYISDVRRSAEERGFSWAFWNMFDGMGMVDDTTRAFDPAIVSALGLTMPPE